MKFIYALISLLVLLNCTHTVLAREPERIAVVDMERLLSEHPNTASDKALLQETLRDYESEGESARKLAEELKESFELAERRAKSAALSDRARAEALENAAAARDEWDQAQSRWMEKMRELQKLLSEQERRMIRRTLSHLNELIEAHALEHGYNLVLDTSGQRLGSMPQVIYHSDTLDITDALIERMHAQPLPGNDVPAETGPNSAVPELKKP